MSVMEPICGEIEYTFLGISVSSKGLAVDESKEVKKARSRRRTRAVAKRLVSGVFKFPLCCRPSTLEDQEDYIEEYSRHIPYAPRKVPESMNQLVPYQRRVPEIRSQHLPHVQRKVPERLSNQLQRKVIIYPPSSGSTLQPISTEDQWRIGFENTSRWESPLQGWSLTGDSYLGVGEPGLHFDSRATAIAYAQKYGWSYRVQGEPERHQRNSSMVGNYGWVELMRPAVKG
ncbi:hypothetical protein M758_4G259400 [Ceratodon purpureus]|nr:hypothetical protein M758_4G259400 [Ceratodon purpureus]